MSLKAETEKPWEDTPETELTDIYAVGCFFDRRGLIEAKDDEEAFKKIVELANNEVPEGWICTRYGFIRLTKKQLELELEQRRVESGNNLQAIPGGKNDG